MRTDDSPALGVTDHAGPVSTRFAPTGPLGFPTQDLIDKGFATQAPQTAFARACPSIEAAVRALTAAGWPPVFVFVFDELWEYVAQYVQPAMATVLGPSCL